MHSGSPGRNSTWKWPILFSCFGIKFFNIGLRKCFGVLLLTLQSHFATDVWVLGLVISVAVSIGDFSGPIVGGLANIFGCRLAVIVGGMLLSLGLCLGSISQTVYQLAIYLCILCGLGFGFTNDPPFAVLGQYFHQHFSLANSGAMAGSSIGIMVLGPLSQFLVDIYGWRGAMLLIGGVVSHIVILGALLIPSDKYHHLSSERGGNTEEEDTGYWKACCLPIIKTTDCSLFKDPMFIIIIFVSTTIRFTLMAWLIYLVPNVVSKGVPLFTASFISTTAGVGDFTGRLLPGVFAGLSGHLLSSLTVWSAGMGVTTVSLLVDTMVESYVGMMILGFFQELGLGMMYSSTNVVLFDEFGRERLVNSMGWVRGISGVGRVLGGIMPGWIYHVTSSYQLSYLIMASIQLLGIIVLNIGRCYFSSNV